MYIKGRLKIRAKDRQLSIKDRLSNNQNIAMTFSISLIFFYKFISHLFKILSLVLYFLFKYFVTLKLSCFMIGVFVFCIKNMQ